MLFILALYAGSLALSLTRNEVRIVGMAVALAILVQIGLWGNLIIGYAIEHALHRRQEEDPGLATAAGALNFITRVFFWSRQRWMNANSRRTVSGPDATPACG